MFFTNASHGKSHLISQALKVCEAVSNGDFEARIIGIGGNQGEVADLCRAINRLIDRTDAYVRESTARTNISGVSRNRAWWAPF